MTARARFTKNDVKRATSGVAAAGFDVSSVVIDPNGKIVIMTGPPNRQKDDEWGDLA
ncbi:MAG TPA: hypothetical protein VF463_19900 [Sphingobium sp.]